MLDLFQGWGRRVCGDRCTKWDLCPWPKHGFHRWVPLKLNCWLRLCLHAQNIPVFGLNVKNMCGLWKSIFHSYFCLCSAMHSLQMLSQSLLVADALSASYIFCSFKHLPNIHIFLKYLFISFVLIFNERFSYIYFYQNGYFLYFHCKHQPHFAACSKMCKWVFHCQKNP